MPCAIEVFERRSRSSAVYMSRSDACQLCASGLEQRIGRGRERGGRGRVEGAERVYIRRSLGLRTLHVVAVRNGLIACNMSIRVSKQLCPCVHGMILAETQWVTRCNVAATTD